MKSILLMFAVFVAGCGRQPASPPPRRVESTPKPVEAAAPTIPEAEPIVRDLDAIRQDKSLHVLFTFNSTGYFVFRGETMGYEYELLSRFAKEQQLRLVPVVIRDSAVLLEKLNRGTGDIVAA